MDNETLCADLCGAKWCRGPVLLDDGTILDPVDGKCPNLDDRNRCMIYETRPQVCRDFPPMFQLVDGCALSALARPLGGVVRVDG